MNIFQYIYVSAASDQFKVDDLPKILQKAREHNVKADVSGLLLFDSGTFVQVLEGPQSEIEPLLKKIATDPRHRNIKALFQKESEKKEFDTWSMGFVNVAALTTGSRGFVNVSTELSSLIAKGTTAEKALRRFLDGSYKKFVQT